MAQPGRLVGEEPERGRMRLREAEPREADEGVVDLVRGRLVDALARSALDEALAVRLERLEAPLAAHRAAKALCLPDREARERDRDVEHLVLEDDDPERRGERLPQELVLDRMDEGGVLPQPAPVLDVRMDGLTLDRAGPDERDLDGEVVDRLWAGAEEALHLRSALDLEHAHRVGVLDLREHRRVVERDAREVDRRVVELRDPVDALLDARQHPEPEQVDLEKARVGAGILVPLAELTARHRGWLHRDELDERPRRDDHSARVLRDVPWQPRYLTGQELKRAPALREQLPLGVRERADLLCDAVRVPAVGHAGEPLELRVREPERLADVADRAARAVRREARHERGVLVAVALGDADDELLADVPRKVEVDVRYRGELPVEEAPEREVVRDRVDV